MSKIALEGNASGTGTFTIASPNSNSNYTLTLPSSTGTVVVTGGAQTIEFAAGTAAAPSITFTGDTNTGIFSPAADTIAFAEGGAEAMRINSSGNVGIGATPTNRFHVADNSASAMIYGLQSGAGDIIALSSGASEKFRITNAGNVGIGTDSPTDGDGYGRIIDIRSATGSAIYFRDSDDITNDTLVIGRDSANSYIDSKSGNLIIYNAGSERARITSGGYFKASNSGNYNGATGAYHEFYQTADSIALVITAINANYSTAGCLYFDISRNTTNNSFYAISYYNSGAGAYKFRVADSGNCTNTNGSYGTISDAKLKQDIVDAGSQWDDIKNLRFRKYRLKSEVELDPNAKPFLGLVAQEAELVSPGLIEEHRDTKQETKTREVEKTREIPAVLDEEGNEVEPARTETYTETEEYTETVDLGTTTKSIKTSILYMKAVKALQEAMTRIEALEAEVAALKGQ